MGKNSDLVPAALRQIAATIHRLPRLLLLALGTALLTLVADIDGRSGPHIPLSLFYVVPIALVTWYVGGWWGMLFAFFGGVASFVYSFHRFPMTLPPMIIAWGLTARVGSFVVTTALVWWLKLAVESQRALANTDELTGIRNARAFRAAAATEIARAEREGGLISAIFIDCDHFKSVNDRFGHAAGDQLLRLIAKTMLNHVRVTDHVGRLGGDEFGILIPGADVEACRGIATKLDALLLEAVHQQGWPVTFSAGAATFLVPPSSVDDLLGQIDQLQYEAKSSGKNRIAYRTIGAPAALAA